jgi:hypothetical protein
MLPTSPAPALSGFPSSVQVFTHSRAHTHATKVPFTVPLRATKLVESIVTWVETLVTS